VEPERVRDLAADAEGAHYGDPHWPGCGFASAGAAAGISECRRRGWAGVHVPGEGFRPCRADGPGSYVDLDRYVYWLTHGDAGLEGNEGRG
jgi:hypothetical protein